MRTPTPHPVTLPTGLLLARLGSTATAETTFEMEKLLDAIIQHAGLADVLGALANIAKVNALADRSQTGETGRADSWLTCELYLRELMASPDAEIVSQR